MFIKHYHMSLIRASEHIDYWDDFKSLMQRVSMNHNDTEEWEMLLRPPPSPPAASETLPINDEAARSFFANMDEMICSGGKGMELHVKKETECMCPSFLR